MGYNPHKTFREIHENGGGLKQLFFGLDAALYARLSHLFVRNLVYKFIYDRKKPVKPTNDLSIREKAVISGFAGFLGALVSNPFELVMIRQIHEGTLPSNQRRNYKGAIDGIKKIIASEGGAQALWKGFLPTALKTIVLNATLTGCYDYMNEKMWICFGPTSLNRPLSILWAALWGSLLTLPFDNIKTRLQKQFADPTKDRLSYVGFNDAVISVTVYERPHSFWVGLFPYYLKVALYTTLTVYMMDKITTKWKRKAGLTEEQI